MGGSASRQSGASVEAEPLTVQFQAEPGIEKNLEGQLKAIKSETPGVSAVRFSPPAMSPRVSTARLEASTMSTGELTMSTRVPPRFC